MTMREGITGSKEWEGLGAHRYQQQQQRRHQPARPPPTVLPASSSAACAAAAHHYYYYYYHYCAARPLQQGPVELEEDGRASLPWPAGSAVFLASKYRYRSKYRSKTR